MIYLPDDSLRQRLIVRLGWSAPITDGEIEAFNTAFNKARTEDGMKMAEAFNTLMETQFMTYRRLSESLMDLYFGGRPTKPFHYVILP